MAKLDSLRRLGALVRRLREEKGWTLQDLSHATGLSLTYLNQIELAAGSRGREPATPSDDTLGALAQALSISLGEINSTLGRIPEEDRLSPDERELVRHYRGAPPSIRQAARAVLDLQFRADDTEETTHGRLPD